jgi:carboxyl-terminal processing protease
MLNLISRSLLSLSLLALVACGGGGGGGGLGNGGGGNNNGNGWQQGVYLDFISFYAMCEAPRGGTNPATGNPYQDVQGDTLDENNFLRSYTNDTYLWYDEVTDRDPGLYNNPLDYFELLRTNDLTPSGTAKDQFHFTYDSDEWYQLSQSGVSFGYGVTWAFISNTPPRKLLIAYTEPNSPATNIPIPLARGADILAIDGVDVDFGTDVDTLNAGLFASAAGEQHTFRVLDLGSNTPRDVVLTSASITAATVQNTQVISTPTGEVGYMTFNDHLATAEQALIDAVNQLNAHNNGDGIDDLVLDLRYNGGGYLAIASELAYMIAGPGPTAGTVFEEMNFNDKHPATDPVTGQALSPTPFYTTTLGPPFNATPGQALPSLDLPRVYVLTGRGTCSASEAIINGLRGVGVEVIQIGSTTCGKPYGFYPTDNCGTTYFTIQFKGANHVGFGDYSDGFSAANATGPGEDVPGCSVADDFTKQLGDPTETRLATALAYRDGAGCPAATGVAPGVFSKASQSSNEVSQPLNAVEPFVPKSPWQTNRILTPQ